MDTASQIRLQAVCPALAAKIQSLDAEFQRQTASDVGGPDQIEIVQGLRSSQEQLAAWAKGRTQHPDGSWIVTDAAAVVTDAPPGESWHEFGLAVDVVPRSLLPIPGWNPASPLWATITSIAQSLGLACGACWVHKDIPHLQLTGKFPVTPTAAVRGIFNLGGVQAVWNASGVLDA